MEASAAAGSETGEEVSQNRMLILTVRDASLVGQWVYIAAAVVSLCWFVAQRRAQRCNWEAIWVSAVVGRCRLTPG